MDSEWFDRVFNPKIDDGSGFYKAVAAELGKEELSMRDQVVAYAARKVTIARFGSDV